MTAMRAGWLILNGLLWWCFLYLGSSTALALALFLVLVPAVSLPIRLWACSRLDVCLETGHSQRKGDGGTMILRLKNPTFFPLLRVRCDVYVQNQLNRELQKMSLYTWVMPGKTQVSRLRISSEYCGRLKIWVPKVMLYDMFGLFGVSCKCDAVSHLVVQPDTFEPVVTLVPNPAAADDSDSYSQERPGSDMSETFQIREYVEGDSIRQIHWKLSGKFDRLIVRDPGLPVSRNVLVFWERTGESANPALIDAQAETVISVCRSLADSGVSFQVGWNDTDRNLCVLYRIREMDEFVGVIPRLLRATGCREGASGAGLLVQTGAEALCAHMVYIAENPQSEVLDMQRYGHVTMLVCGGTAGEDGIYFNETDYEQQLAEIAI